MKKVFGFTLGVLSAIGGFVDIGDIVANAAVGARYKWALAWVVGVGIVGIMLFAEMAGRVAAVSGRAVFDLVRERLGPRFALANLVGSFFVNLMTLTAEIAGVALALELATDVNYLVWLPVCALAVWIVIWRVKFETMEDVFGIVGLAMIVVAVTVWRAGPDWGSMFHEASHPSLNTGQGLPTYFYYAIALFGAAMTPYEVFFFSSGAVEEHWTRADLFLNRVNVYVGFPLGGLLSLALMSASALYLAPLDISVEHLGQVALPTSLVLGKLGLAALLIGFFAATFGAALETALSAGYTIAQYFGWQWGKFVRPRDAARFHTVVLATVVVAAVIGLSSVDPIKVTEYSLIFSAVALPLTYIPILVVANDPGYMGDKVNRRFSNALGSVYLVIIMVAAVAAVPLMLVTKAGA
jgi:Mn2+/Fe2+ NRAMP family transporter